MNNSNKTGMGHNDNSPFMDVIFGETGNMIVCGKTASGKTTMLQTVINHDTASKAGPGKDGEYAE